MKGNIVKYAGSNGLRLLSERGISACGVSRPIHLPRIDGARPRGWVAACLVVLSLSISSCFYAVPSDNTHQVFIDEGFTVGERADIYSAMLAWEHATDGYIHLEPTLVDQGPHLIRIVPAKKGELGLHAGVCHQETLNSTQTISLVPITAGSRADSFVQTVEHELGHCMGLDHDVPDTVMCRTVGPAGCASRNITCRDVERLCLVWGCVAEDMAVCKL